ncbi:MAG TPA: hypothetical protein VIQ02_12870, partial [Jiangellaceae bacterium]
TVSEVERHRRMVTVPELLALTLALGATIQQLLDPRGPERIRGPRLALVEDEKLLQLPPGPAEDQPGRRMNLIPVDASAMVCSHESSMDVQWDPEQDRIAGILLSGEAPSSDIGPEARP